MIRRGVSEQIAIKISGHETASVFRRYNIISDTDLRNAAIRIEGGRGSQGTLTVQSDATIQEIAVN